MIAQYPVDSAFKVYCEQCYQSDSWAGENYGKDYDFSRSFFDQFKELIALVPHPGMGNLQCVNSDYCNYCYQQKNCYLSFASDLNEDSGYLYHTVECKNSYDQLASKGNERCYEAVASSNCYQCAYVYFSKECINSRLLHNCKNLENCICCVNMSNAKNCIFNQQYSKEDYERKKGELCLETYSGLKNCLKVFKERIEKYPKRFSDHIKTENVTGDYLHQVKNCIDCFDIEGPAENCRYVTYGIPNFRDIYDAYGLGANIEQCYEIMGCGANVQNARMCQFTWEGHSNTYCYYCRGSSYLFGCFGLKRKEYSILNKQYSKDEYFSLAKKVEQHMMELPYVDARERVYKFGEFFPADLSPFAYNYSLAAELKPLTKSEVESQGYLWRDSDLKDYTTTQNEKTLPENIAEVGDMVLKEIIACKHAKSCNELCTGAFKLTPAEYEFYKAMGLPIPRLCPNCRHFARLKERNNFRLYNRKCMCAGTNSENDVYVNNLKHPHAEQSCDNNFKTTFDPLRPEIVYCEQCYQAEAS